VVFKGFRCTTRPPIGDIQPRFETDNQHEGTVMPTIPDPETLMETARSASRPVEDREWKQYQCYLAKYEGQHGITPDEPPLTFEEFCARLRKNEYGSQELQNRLDNE